MIVHSLRSKINLIFFIIFLLLSLLFVAALKYDNTKAEEFTASQERAMAHYLYLYYLKYGTIDTAYLEAQNISVITDKGHIVQIERYFKERGKYKRYAVDTFAFKRIIIINNDHFKLFLENKNTLSFPVKRVIIFGVMFVLLFLLYWWIVRSLRPISILKNKIQTFSEGDLNISCKSNQHDEIAEVANEFDHAVKTIRELIHSRQLFLRTIMHELKTPIAKGRLVSELLPDERNKQRLHSIFERLNLLIDEFAKIEKITSNTFTLNINSYKMSDIIEASIDMLMFENPHQYVSIETKGDYLVNVDFELFTLVVKNLLDNGIKYSPNKHVTVTIHNNQLSIKNRGNQLPEPLKNYYQPFHTSQIGLGLGLYIVKSIVDIHKMALHYGYEEGSNIFTIV
jgi:two-component system OmpR family sensor kinase